MINIIDKSDCVGCNACTQRCPVSCINMVIDSQGFKYPHVDLTRCIDCHMCENVCPVIHQDNPRVPAEVSAVYNRDYSVRYRSSSGGVFHALAKTILDQSGVVFGARFNSSWQVVHDYCENIDALPPFMGSKYVQSEIGETYTQAEAFLKSGRKVLFSGTSCQIAGLKLFLRKDYGSQLLCIEVVCHGVPSPAIWRDYIKYLQHQHHSSIKTVSFRDKTFGWEQFSLAVSFDDKDSKPYVNRLNRDTYISGFLKNIYLRPSCYKCPAKEGKSKADIALADFWNARHIQSGSYHFDGISLVLAYSRYGCEILNSCSGLGVDQLTYEKALESNKAISHSVSKPVDYKAFWNIYQKDGIDGLLTFVKARQPSRLFYLRMNITNRIKRLLAGMGIEKR